MILYVYKKHIIDASYMVSGRTLSGQWYTHYSITPGLYECNKAHNLWLETYHKFDVANGLYLDIIEVPDL
jgi:hypothetical protein